MIDRSRVAELPCMVIVARRRRKKLGSRPLFAKKNTKNAAKMPVGDRDFAPQRIGEAARRAAAAYGDASRRLGPARTHLCLLNLM